MEHPSMGCRCVAVPSADSRVERKGTRALVFLPHDITIYWRVIYEL